MLELEYGSSYPGEILWEECDSLEEAMGQVLISDRRGGTIARLHGRFDNAGRNGQGNNSRHAKVPVTSIATTNIVCTSEGQRARTPGSCGILHFVCITAIPVQC
jgi:hypothetical protein